MNHDLKYSEEKKPYYQAGETNIPLIPEIQCNFCNEKFSSLSDLRSHLIEEFQLEPDCISFLNLELGIPEPPKQKIEFPKVFLSNYLRCSDCDLFFKGYKGLREHIAKVHSETANEDNCQLCGKFFKNKYALKFHMRQVHEKSTRVSCRICMKPIYNKYQIKAHMKRFHPLNIQHQND